MSKDSGIKASSASTLQQNGELQTLIKFINRLGNAMRGIDVELDLRLAKIRSLTTKSTPDLTELKPLFEDVTQILQRQAAQVEYAVQETRDGTHAATRQLLQHNHLSTADRVQLRDVLTQFDTPVYSVMQLLPLLNQVLQLYRNKLSASETPDTVNEQVSSLQGELANLLTTIDFSGVNSNAMQTIRQRLLGTLSIEQLMHLCMDSLRIVIKAVNDERNSAQQFLHILNDALGSVSKVLARAVHSADVTHEAQSDLSGRLENQVSQLSESVEQATSLQDLKATTQKHIALISSTLTEKHQLEAAERTELKKQLLSMQARLEDVESEAKMYKRQLTEQKFKSLQDSLTRLPNRAAFEERLQLEYQRWQSYAAPLTIAIVDIDHFKVINDSYGHIAGDKTLQVIANMLKKSLRDTDFVCRYGGEEFVILFPQTTIETACELLEKSRHRIKSIPFKFKNTSISITISAGVACFNADDNNISVFERADRALYQAKDNGRDRVSHL
ncbi:diguanylate cyclase [Aliidiomarina sp. Khilg15.8]